ncbi:MAG TPA: hypothetical protein VMQ73_10540 [Methylomirabilota bacterium]|nr:hypothetical protein [Methylomirabilota bacterium]
MSEDAGDKLQASLHYDRREGVPDEAYLRACAEWFRALSDADKTIAKNAADTYRNGYPMRARQIAAALPSAPKYPP